ncbi:MAG: 2-phospho-L-lactate guanylyltransferase [Nocardioides sp.]
MTSSSSARFGVVVPVKPPAVAKSRLGGLGDDVRRALAAAFAADTVAAALASERVACVLVVTDDHVLARELAGTGVEVIPDGAADDLNASLGQAAAELLRRHPGLRIAALCADLPALRPTELTRALDAASCEAMAFVPDADGAGTTVVTAPDLETFRPCFGHRSRAAHLDAGADEIDVDDIASVRRDVDTPADLADVLRLGIGPWTSRVTAGLF